VLCVAERDLAFKMGITQGWGYADGALRLPTPMVRTRLGVYGRAAVVRRVGCVALHSVVKPFHIGKVQGQVVRAYMSLLWHRV
jgi:hypothetical protein